jgi:predicted lipid-binding transport protein (Tim44 family)
MLGGTVEEVGTDLPTVVDPQAYQALAAIQQRDPAFEKNGFNERVGYIFHTMQAAWSGLEWDHARPFLTDNLFESQKYWIDAYRRSGLRNITERSVILRIDPARVTRDRWYDAITVRVYATGLDYTIRDADGALVGGSRSKERQYSEYWTLIRGVSARGPSRTKPECPKCGAALDISMAGNCKHCSAKVNSGEFDWVLARIEQDEVYTG